MKITEIFKKVNEDASGGATSTGAIASVPTGQGKKKKDVGTLFGGAYKQTKETKDNVVRR